MRDPATPPDTRRTILRSLQETFPEYALLAFMDPAGRVVVDSKRLVEGQDASSRPFFQRARDRAVVEDVHDAVMLARLVRGGGGDLARFVDIADPAARAALAEAGGRVRAVAEVHHALYRADMEAGQSVDLGLMLRDLCEQLGRTLPSTVSLHSEPPSGLVQLSAERALPVGLLVAELLANAAKHAFPDGRGGNVWVNLRRLPEGGTELAVTDDGVGAPPAALRNGVQGTEGLGMCLVESLARRIGATLQAATEPGGGTRLALILSETPSAAPLPGNPA
jgi:two-component sensor histidine kinase